LPICKKQTYADHPVTQRTKGCSSGSFPSRIASQSLAPACGRRPGKEGDGVTDGRRTPKKKRPRRAVRRGAVRPGRGGGEAGDRAEAEQGNPPAAAWSSRIRAASSSIRVPRRRPLPWRRTSRQRGEGEAAPAGRRSTTGGGGGALTLASLPFCAGGQASVPRTAPLLHGQRGGC
jgi:hypothetical protein